MNLDLTKTVFYARGKTDLKKAVEEVVDSGLDAESRNRLFRLSNQIHSAKGSIELDSSEVELLMKCVERNALDPWAYGSLCYLIQPEKMAESDRAIFEKRHTEGE